MTDSPQQIPLQKQTRLLENRLDKAMIKYNEALSIRRTYATRIIASSRTFTSLVELER